MRYIKMSRNLKASEKQVVKFTRTATKDAVSGKVTYNDWTPASGKWDEVDAPVINGYQVTPQRFAEETVTPDSEDQTVNFMYTAIGNAIIVNFTDDNNNGSVVGSVSLHGLVGQTASQASNIQEVAQKVSELQGKGFNATAPDLSTTFFSNKLQTVTQGVQHKIISNITPDNPQGVSGLTKDVTRTINFITNN